MFNLLGKKNKIAVYTAIFGDYDELKEPPEGTRNCDFICFTDNNNLESKNYQIRVCERQFEDPTRDARMYKVLSHQFLSEYKYTAWIDGMTQIKKPMDMRDFIRKQLKKYRLAIFKHPDRNCIYDEIEACKILNKDDVKMMEKQVSNYKKLGFPKDYGLVATGVILRKNLDPQVIKLNEAWWNEIKKGSKRDQLSFNYVCWKNNFKYQIIEGYYWDNEYTKMVPHKRDC